jgi:hypothetical protein
MMNLSDMSLDTVTGNNLSAVFDKNEPGPSSRDPVTTNRVDDKAIHKTGASISFHQVDQEKISKDIT